MVHGGCCKVCEWCDMTASFCFSRIYEFGISSVSVSCCYGVHLSLKKNGKARQAEEGRNYKAQTPFCRCHDPYNSTKPPSHCFVAPPHGEYLPC